MNAIGWIGLVLASGAQAADTSVLRHEAIVEAPVAEVWKAFTTAEGLKSWMAAHADIDLRVGGKMRTRYAGDGTLGDGQTIENVILSLEPERMFSVKVAKSPEGFAFANTIERMWTVLRFEELGAHRTRVTCTSMRFGEDEESRRMREHFDMGNAWTLKKLQEKFARSDGGSGPDKTESAASAIKRIEVDTVVRATPRDVWEAWTTSEGIATFFAQASKVELRPGGAFEMYFGADAPKGSQGSEGCTVLAYRPLEMLSFTWNAPPKWQDLRTQRTVVVVQFADLGVDGVRVALTHTGFGQGKDWDEVHQYFSKAWPTVLGRLKERFAKATG